MIKSSDQFKSVDRLIRIRWFQWRHFRDHSVLAS